MQYSLPANSMKSIILILTNLLFAFALGGQDIALNHAGHIIIPAESIKEASYFEEDGKKVIRLGDIVFQGNGIYEIKNGYLTLEAYEITVPIALRFYDEAGKKQHKMHVNRVYNPVFSPDKSYMLFFDAQHLTAVNTKDYSVRKFPGSAVFSIDNRGNPVFYDEENKQVIIGRSGVPFEKQPHKILIHRDNPIIFTRHSIYVIDGESPVAIHDLEGTFFRARLHDNKVYFVTKQTEKDRFIFTLFHIDDQQSVSVLDSTVYERKIRTLKHEAIPSPLKYGENYEHPIGNSYGAIQQYGGGPYLHAGVDLLGDPYEDVFAVADGVVKAVLTTGGDYHWRIAIANEDTPEETDGYLYAHLVKDNIPFAIGDSVYAGEVVGDLVPWPGWDFTHIHFARITDEGEIWDGAWWTTNNPHIDIYEIIDNTPPVFRNAIGDYLFAFRDEHYNYLDPNELSGDIRIIARIHDLANTHWGIDVFKIRFALYDIEDPDNPVVEKISFAYDFKLDTYITGEYQNMILETIYSRDATCFSIANYNEREYYQIISNTSGTEDIKEGDKDILFNTKKFPNGTYILRVWAKDASMNESYADMTIGIYNEGHIPTYEVTFDVKDENNEPITGATITLDGQTNAPGDYVFTDIEPGTYDYTVEKEGYETVEGEVEVVNEDVTVDVIMHKTTYEVVFNVVDEDNEPLTDAVVTLDGMENAPGDYVFTDVDPGIYDYMVEKGGYETAEGVVEVVDENVTVEVTMHKVTYEVAFNVDITRAIDHGLLEGFDPGIHSIKITGSMLDWAVPGSDPASQVMEKLTGDPMVYGIIQHLEAGTYEYKYYSDLLGEGFEGGEWEDGDNRVVEVVDEMLVEDIFGPDDLQVISPGDVSISLYPNPVRSTLFVKSDTEIVKIRMVNMLGHVVYSTNVGERHHEISVSDLKTGIYFLQLTTRKGVITYKVQVTG